jgi:hypothetical protein
MLRGFRWLALAGVVAIAALVGPTAAFACGGGGSATSIYTEQLCNAKGGTHSTSGKTAKPSQPSTGSQNPYVSPPAVVPPVHISHKTARAIEYSGKDKIVLRQLTTNPNFVDSKRLKTERLASGTAQATMLGSAFGLGAGPTIFFALLLGTVLVLLGTGSVRAWRNRHRV